VGVVWGGDGLKCSGSAYKGSKRGIIGQSTLKLF